MMLSMPETLGYHAYHAVLDVGLVDVGGASKHTCVSPIKLTYSGGHELGAWRQTRGEPATPISTRKIDSSEFAIVASKDHAGPLVSAMLARVNHPRLERWVSR
jgi:hypothetical protein